MLVAEGPELQAEPLRTGHPGQHYDDESGQSCPCSQLGDHQNNLLEGDKWGIGSH